MNRLRVRVELNRRRAGVPMHELVSVVEETHKFFQLLAEDVDIDTGRGEWHASNFDPESLNFTAEFDGPASSEQISSFGSSFAGATSLRRETISQFTRIADFIGDDELVGFGLYHTDEENEPTDWRCLSRQDAMRFADEIHLLARVSGEMEQEAPLPAVINGAVGGRRLFKDRRERENLAADPARYVREVESSLTRRIAQLEGALESQTKKLQLFGASPAAEERFFKMLAAIESHPILAPRPLMLSAPEPPHPVMIPVPRNASKSRMAVGIGLSFAAAALIVAGANAKYLRLTGSPQPAAITLAPGIPAAPPIAAVALTPAIRQEADESAAPPVQREAAEMDHQFALEVPQDLKPLVGAEVSVNMIVAIDREGNVTTADVLSTKGDGADVLVPVAVKAARRFHFRPARQGKKAIASKSMLGFTFNPE